MRKVGRILGRGLLLLAVLGVAGWVFGPREPAARSLPVSAAVEAPWGLLATREAGFDDIVPGAEARVVWAGEEGAPTRWVVLYLHGFSATSEEIRPVPDRVAEALGANLVFNRLPGHGRSGAAMAEPGAGDWLDDTDLMLDIARGLGDRVLVISTSTGGTLAAYAAGEPDMALDVAGMVFVSPNIRVADPAGVVLEWPFAATFVPWILGPERAFEPVNAGQATYWTEAYPSIAMVRLGALMRETRARDAAAATVPALVLVNPEDPVISAAAAEAYFAGWGGPALVERVALPEGGDPHVLAGDILNPEMTAPIAARILDWVGGLQD